jgi:hypothetical protein
MASPVTEIVVYHLDGSPIGEFDVPGYTNDGMRVFNFEHMPMLSRTIRIYMVEDNTYRVNFFEHGEFGDVERDTLINATRGAVLGWLVMCEFAFNVFSFDVRGTHVTITNAFGDPMTLSEI